MDFHLFHTRNLFPNQIHELRNWKISQGTFLGKKWLKKRQNLFLSRVPPSTSPSPFAVALSPSLVLAGYGDPSSWSSVVLWIRMRGCQQMEYQSERKGIQLISSFFYMEVDHKNLASDLGYPLRYGKEK